MAKLTTQQINKHLTHRNHIIAASQRKHFNELKTLKRRYFAVKLVKLETSRCVKPNVSLAFAIIARHEVSEIVKQQQIQIATQTHKIESYSMLQLINLYIILSPLAHPHSLLMNTKFCISFSTILKFARKLQSYMKENV